jgi:hypothetical protein
MEIRDFKAAPELSQTFRMARQLGLESNIAELEAFGFTIVPPEKAAPRAVFDRMLEAVLAIGRAEDELKVSMANRPQAERPVYGRALFHLLHKHPVFAEGAINPVGLTLARYMMGASCHLWNTSSLVKEGPVGTTRMHCDSMGVPTPLPPNGVVCNVSWILTDYTKEKGTFCMVPSSHRWCRHPTDVDQPKFMGGPNDDDIGVPVEAAPGSLIVFHGNTWHGTYPKTDEGLRSHFVYMYARNYVRPAERNDDIPDALIETYGPDFARLCGRAAWQGYGEEGPSLDGLKAARAIQTGPFS